MEDERDVQVVDWSLWREAEFNGEWLVYLKRIGRLSLLKHDSAEILKAGRFYVPTIKLFDLIFGNGWSFPLKLWVLGQEALVGIVDDLVVLRRQIAPTLRDFCRKGPGRLCRSVLHRGAGLGQGRCRLCIARHLLVNEFEILRRKVSAVADGAQCHEVV